MASEQKSITLFVLKVELRDYPGVWRRIDIRPTHTLDQFHSAIFRAFDRFDPHLYSFYLFPEGVGEVENIYTDAGEYAAPEMAEDNGLGFEDEKPKGNAGKAKIGLLGLAEGDVFLYLFDYGDEWWHEITVEKTDEPVKTGRYPKVVERQGESPPQYPDYEEEE